MKTLHEPDVPTKYFFVAGGYTSSSCGGGYSSPAPAGYSSPIQGTEATRIFSSIETLALTTQGHVPISCSPQRG